MIKFRLIAICLTANLFYSQSVNNAKAPNSYVYDIDMAVAKNYGGIKIPVVKAYEMWSKYEYLKSNGVSNPIPAGVQTVSVYWEDVPGLLQNVELESGTTPADSKILVKINPGKGKGNAVVAFKVDGTIYWTWHIWVTDNPENGVFYNYYNVETDIDLNPINIQYMDRNLGATSNSFLGNQWNKSGGLMYEWGRKDPFPPLVYKDGDFYEISGEVGFLKHRQIASVSTIPVVVRPFNEIEKNIQYSVKNPITYIINTDATGNWFSSSRYKVAAPSPNYKTWDLWADNAKGGNSNGNSSNTALKNESLSYELKSELDPCPNGWRIPSYKGRETQNNNLAVFGRKDWLNDDVVVEKRQLFPNSVNPSLDGIKVYPGLGMDFTNAQGGARNLGLLSLSGGYVYYPNVVAPNAPVGTMFQDNSASGGFWSATYAFDGARGFSMVSDPFRNSTSVGLHAVYNNETFPTKSGNAVKCMRDPNLLKIGDFATEYIPSPTEDYKDGLYTPNSYIITGESNLQIPVNKAFSVYNQLLSDHKMLAADALFVKILWTSNLDLIYSVDVLPNGPDIKNSYINIDINPEMRGNAVVSLHQGSTENPVLWSWHLWAPDEDPTVNTISYTTENPAVVPYNFVNPTASKLPPLKTIFMDRNLGAQSSDLSTNSAYGLHYQWGRKDPIPTFLGENAGKIYVSNSSAIVASSSMDWIDSVILNEITELEYAEEFTDSYGVYGSVNPVPHLRVRDNINYSVENPLRFLYQDNWGEIFNGGNPHSNDLNKINDWVSNKRSEASDRWGHADRKSPFDPCPKGWRVPDVSFNYLYTSTKGNSPWYNSYQADAYGNAGVLQSQWHDVNIFYGGSVESNGWKFENPVFNIGSFPKDGMRGELGGKYLKTYRSGVWTAAMADLNTGYALSMQFQVDKMETGTGAYPQAAMGVRCAKDLTRLLVNAPSKDEPLIALKNETKELIVKPLDNEVRVYPNPFRDEFYLNNLNSKNYEIYDFSGKLILKGAVEEGKIKGNFLQSGQYIVKIYMKDGSVVSKKIFKK